MALTDSSNCVGHGLRAISTELERADEPLGVPEQDPLCDQCLEVVLVGSEATAAPLEPQHELTEVLLRAPGDHPGQLVPGVLELRQVRLGELLVGGVDGLELRAALRACARGPARRRTGRAPARRTTGSVVRCPPIAGAQTVRDSFSSSTWNGSLALKSALLTLFWLLANWLIRGTRFIRAVGSTTEIFACT